MKLKAFDLRFLDLIKGGHFAKRAIRVSAPRFDAKFGLWRCSLELVGVLLPANVFGVPEPIDGPLTPETAQLTALRLAQRVLADRVLVNRDGTKFVVPKTIPTAPQRTAKPSRRRPRSPAT